MADILYSNLPEKLTPSVNGDKVIITDSQDGDIVKIQDALQFKGEQGDKGDKGDPGEDGKTITTITSNKVGKTTTVTINGDYDNSPQSFDIEDGTGDMLASVYDPQNIQADAFARANHTGTQSIDTITETTDKKVMTADERTQIETSRSSYVISSSVSINAGDNTKFDFSATGVVKEGNTIYPINISQTAISPTFLATEKVTFILVDKNGNLVQQSSPATSAQIKTHLAEWVIVHSNNTTVNAVNNNSLNGDNELNQFQAYARNFGYVNLNGNRYSANGTNLKIDKSAGRIMFPGLGQNNEKEQIAQTALSFRIRNQDGSETTDITDLDVVNYDNGGVTTAIPGATNSVWAVYRIYLFADSNITRLARPQFYYDTKEEAQLSFRNENFILEKNLDDNGMLAGYILFRKNTTNLSDIDNEFISAEGSGSFGGTSFIPTLQASYNVSPQPQIITDNGSFQLQGGETDTDDVLEIKDTLGTTTATIQANGVPTKGTDLVRKTELDGKVGNTGDETIAGVKTFSSSPIVPTPTTDFQAATKKYVDDNAGGGTTKSACLISCSNQTLISGSTTRVKFDSADFDINGDFDTVTSNWFNCPRDGLYLVGFSTTVSVGHNTYLYINSNLTYALSGSESGTSTNSGTILLNLTSGNKISISCKQDSGLNKGLNGGTFTKLSIREI